MTVPLTKVFNHILVLQTQIVLDRQTDSQTDVFCWKNEKPQFLSANGTTKKAAFGQIGLFVYPCIPIWRKKGLGLGKPGKGRNHEFQKLKLSPKYYIAFRKNTKK